jgi:tetratricopeptide (TPR) repeat protein
MGTAPAAVSHASDHGGRALRVLVWVMLNTVVCGAVTAEPFVPASDDEVLERLAVSPSDPALRELRALRGQLRQAPNNLVLATRVAQGYLELGRLTGDPRYAGYSEAALTSWWHLDNPPPEVLVLRATLRQRMHQFDAALADLTTVLNSNPRNAQARLTRATVLLVQGAYEAAREECGALKNLTSELVWTACLTGVTASTGDLDDSYRQLRAAFERRPPGQVGLQSWVLTSLAEMAARAGIMPEAESHFRAALAVDAADTYLLGAYADFLLDSDRSPEVLPLLRDKTGADPLLLRYALALQAQHSKELPAQVEKLRDRFAASRLRGDRVHLREEARFTLHLLAAPEAALKLARENWQVQKEPADVRILLESALAAHSTEAIDAVRDWLNESQLEDVQLTGPRVIPRCKPMVSASVLKGVPRDETGVLTSDPTGCGSRARLGHFR